MALVEAAATLLRSDPRDPDGVASADHALATSLDMLHYIVQWAGSRCGGEGEGEEGDFCLLLVRQLNALGFMQGALALHEALTLVSAFHRHRTPCPSRAGHLDCT